MVNFTNEYGTNVYVTKDSKCKLDNIARDISSGDAQLRKTKHWESSDPNLLNNLSSGLN